MSTRGCIGFVLNGKRYMTYNHSDSYPNYLYRELLYTLRNIAKSDPDWLQKLRRKVANLTILDRNKKPTEDMKSLYKHYSNIGVSEGTLDDLYCLFRELQGIKWIEEIWEDRLFHILDDEIFLWDGLFCEWAYVVDLDKEMLFVGKGFCKTLPACGTIFTPEELEKMEPDEHGYYPVNTIFIVYDLNDIHKLTDQRIDELILLLGE